MHVSAQASYPASAQRVATMLADEQFVARKVAASGALSHSSSVVGSADEAFTVTTRRQMPTTEVPAQLRALIGASLEVRLVEAWEAPGADERRGTVVLEVTGAPVRLSGTLWLRPDGGSTTVMAEGELKATVPLFGSVVEEAAAGALRAAFAAEERAGRAWLAERA